MSHRLEFFHGGCPLCNAFLADVEVGKCAGCRLRVHDVREARNRRAMAKYGVRVVPTLVIDGRIKVEGRPDFLWMCGEEFYAMLERTHPLRPAKEKRPLPVHET